MAEWIIDVAAIPKTFMLLVQRGINYQFYEKYFPFVSFIFALTHSHFMIKEWAE
jgi:hypothetical protein